MKILLILILFISPLFAHAKNIEKIFFSILDEYIEHELPIHGLDKDDVILYVILDQIEEGFAMNLAIYALDDYPDVDTLQMYNGVRTLIRYPKKLKKKISSHFTPLDKWRNTDTQSIGKMIECKRTYLFQVNRKNQIYIMETSDNDHYLKKLKQKRIKFRLLNLQEPTNLKIQN